MKNNEQLPENTGYIFSPYLPMVNETRINNETVWYKSIWKNLFLKIKHLFKPNGSILKRYRTSVNPKLYKKIEIELNDDEYQ